jgi:hypothetical protein
MSRAHGVRESRRDAPRPRQSRFDSDNDSDEDVEQIISKTRQTKKESLESTRRAMRRLQEAEDMAGNTYDNLISQSG